MRLDFESCQVQNTVALNNKGKTIRLTFLGDGATANHMPLINDLTMPGEVPPPVLAINDCTKHMVAGGKKDAPYIAGIFEGEAEALDSIKALVCVFFFDRTSNVKKASKILEAKSKCLHSLCRGK